MRNRKKLIKQKLLRNSLRDAAAGIKRKPTIPQPQRPSHHPNTSTRVAPATTSAATQSPQRAHRRGPFRLGNCPPFPNPEVLGDTPEPEYEPEGIEADPQYTGGCEKELENNDCSDPDEINKMEFEDRAIWLGKWFAHHYAAWVEDFEMKELQSYPTSSSVGIQRAINVGPLPMLECTFARFRLLEDEWRSPSFCSPFRLGLRRFRNEVVSTVRMHAIRIFGITDIVTIDHRDESQQVTALYTDNKFLYEHGNTGSIGDFMRSDCLVKESVFWLILSDPETFHRLFELYFLVQLPSTAPINRNPNMSVLRCSMSEP
ncbi:hypothetical protein BJ322DRAFT_724064 [Thelephora terrestris]|uniref:Uncharacterized protein n=1 Tax=Thelephora terrestris TaxID=56493 RepID=A0A9P6L858_9AGAM|nr:hypothetical protein BJ322DRAFT_724064 [Thelephora terrestris]